MPRTAHAFTINLTYDSSVTSLSNASQVETATNYAAQQLENVLTNNITVNIDVQADTSDFGASGTGLGGIYSYSDIRSDLTAAATTPVDASAVAMMNALPDPTQGGNFWIPSAEMKAFGLTDPNGTGNDGAFVFGTDNPWNFSTTNRSVSGEYDFVGVALHELTEAIGRTSGLGENLDNAPGWIPFDLFRFVQPGWESTNNQDNGVYFSVDQGNTNLKNYNPASNGGDLQDWAAGTPDAADQASVQGTENDLSPADIATLDAIGFTPVTAPRTLTWDGSNSLVDSSHWLNNSNQNVPAYIGAALVVNSGTLAYTPPDVRSNLVLSSTSIYGTSLTITGGSVSTLVNSYVSGLGSGSGAGLYLNTGSSLAISGGALDLAGALVIGGDSGSNVTATITGGSIVVGQGTAADVDPTLYVGLAGTGKLTQSGNSTITTQNLYIASNPGSSGNCTLNGGSMVVSGTTAMGGNATAAGGTGSLTIYGSSSLQTGKLIVWSGTLQVNGLLQVTGNTSNSGTINLLGNQAGMTSISGTGSVTVGGNARASVFSELFASSINQSSLTINSSGYVSLTRGTPTTDVLQSLTIVSNGTLDLADNNLDINYGTSASPVSTIRGYLTTGYFDGAFNCYGITSSTAAANPKHSTALGYTDTGSQIIIKYTWYGDADLNGVVNASDLADMKSNGTTWATGDFNYDGKVNQDDYALFMAGAAASNGKNISTTLPEPGAMLLILWGGVALPRKQR
ncbi:MAG TPA: NF038122 family metalloprotease [Tepidisphaeraceae bacterium]